MSNLEIRYLSVFRPKATAEIVRCQEDRDQMSAFRGRAQQVPCVWMEGVVNVCVF